MDILRVAEALQMHPFGALTINAMRLEAWGQDIVFECVYDPGAPGKPLAFQLVVRDCREVRWRVYSHARTGEAISPAQVVNLALGTGQHRRPINLLTDHFGLTALYGEAFVHNGASQVSLSSVDDDN